MQFTISPEAKEFINRKTNTITIQQVTCSSCSGNVSKIAVAAGKLMMGENFKVFTSDDLTIYVSRDLVMRGNHFEISLEKKGEGKNLIVKMV